MFYMVPVAEIILLCGTDGSYFFQHEAYITTVCDWLDNWYRFYCPRKRWKYCFQHRQNSVNTI